MIPFNVPPYVEKSSEYINQAINNHKICGDGVFTKKCSAWLEENFHAKKILLTTSCTHALEMAAILCDLKDGDEVILPSYTFCSTADAFVQRGAKLVFVDIRPDTMNINENLIEQAITSKTKVIVPVHYAGVSCEMTKILEVAKKYNLKVVEDAAQGVYSSFIQFFGGTALGTIGDFGCYSFHETKNYSMGEGGAIIINNDKYIEQAEIIREKGTNRSKFYRGQIDKYTWVDYGSSYLPSELCAAYLWAQLEIAKEINDNRLSIWNTYYKELSLLQDRIELPFIPNNCEHNAHMFYIKCKDLEERTQFISFMKENQIGCSFHYVPLHSSPAGIKFGRFNGDDIYTTAESNRLVRLPFYNSLSNSDLDFVISKTKEFFNKEN